MGSKKSSSPPQPAYQVPQPPTAAQNMQDYITNYPKLFALQQEYDPKLAQQQLDLLEEFGPQYDQIINEQQKAISPYTYGLTEQLAKIASEGMAGGPNQQFQRQYLDQLRAEVGPNAGSGIGADYVSRGFNQQNEDFKRYYQNLGTSLIGRMPLTAGTTPQFQQAGGQYGCGDFATNQQLGYNSYDGALGQVPYYTQPKKSGFNWSGALQTGVGIGGMFL